MSYRTPIHTCFVVATGWAASLMFASSAIAGGPNCDLSCSPGPPTTVSLAWQPPVTQNVSVGDIVTLELYAVRDDPGIFIRTAGLQVLLEWDPQKLELTGHDDTGPYDWFGSGFLDDSNIDDLNNGIAVPPLGVPFNDGNAWYNALGQLPDPFGEGPAIIPAGGLLITTFSFRALAPDPGTEVRIPLSMAQFTCTVIFWGDEIPGCGMTGSLGSATIEIGGAKTIPGDGDNDGDVDYDDYALFVACAEAPVFEASCAPFDFNADQDVDLHDFAGFQLAFGL